VWRADPSTRAFRSLQNEHADGAGTNIDAEKPNVQPSRAPVDVRGEVREPAVELMHDRIIEVG
jgi:hypothetical protein